MNDEKFDLSNPRYRVLKSNAVYDTEKGRIVGTVGKNPHAITAQNAHVLLRKRQEKQSALLRAALRREHNSKMEPKANSSAAVFAESGALLYSEIVLNADAYPRDRLEAWEKLGKHAQVLGDNKDKSEEPQVGAAETVQAVAALFKLMQAAVQRESGEVVDLPQEGQTE
jgi:hypothetical protein